MQWFKHNSNMLTDDKVQTLIMECGAIGYAVYNATLEYITRSITETNCECVINNAARVISRMLDLQLVEVKKVYAKCIEIGLLEGDPESAIRNSKILSRLNTNEVSNPILREMIKNAKENDKNEQKTLYKPLNKLSPAMRDENHGTITELSRIARDDYHADIDKDIDKIKDKIRKDIDTDIDTQKSGKLFNNGGKLVENFLKANGYSFDKKTISLIESRIDYLDLDLNFIPFVLNELKHREKVVSGKAFDELSYKEQTGVLHNALLEWVDLPRLYREHCGAG